MSQWKYLSKVQLYTLNFVWAAHLRLFFQSGIRSRYRDGFDGGQIAVNQIFFFIRLKQPFNETAKEYDHLLK